MYLRTKVSPLNLGNHRDVDSTSGSEPRMHIPDLDGIRLGGGLINISTISVREPSTYDLSYSLSLSL